MHRLFKVTREFARAICRRFLRNAVLRLAFLLLATLARADTPVTPEASPRTQSLMAFLEATCGKKIISGQQEGWRPENELSFEMRYIRDASGKIPALLSMDLSPYTRTHRPGSKPASHAVVDHASGWYLKSNGIVSLCWHWVAPMDQRAFYTKETSFSPARAVTEGTPEYEATLRDIDLIAAELRLLRDARVPVLWRPLHEANGRWFWWGADGPEPFKKLWRMMFERLALRHKLNNLIWVFSPGAGIDLGIWYPGDPYVDIIAPDHYPMDGNHGPAKGIFDEMVALGGGAKLVGFGENGPIPTPELLVSENAGWLFFITWSGSVLTDLNSKEEIKTAYTHPYVLNLGDLPDLKSYPYHPAGKAVKLGFPAAVSDLAVGSPARRDLVVAVQDERGHTVRDSTCTVNLELAKSPAAARLRGTTSAKTVNGLAVFPDTSIDKAGMEFSFKATAGNLQPATSPVFAVGPGSGILRECWTNAPATFLHEPSSATPPPNDSRVLGKAFEAPVQMGTNSIAKYTGYVLPPLTGEYVFWIASDGGSELWLGANAEPASKAKIAEIVRDTPYAKWPHTHEAQSSRVRLEAGKWYYLEALHRQAAGSTHFSVRWRLPNGKEERPIPGSRLATPNDYPATKQALNPKPGHSHEK